MSAIATDPLEQLIRDAGEGWLIDWNAPRWEALSRLRDMLHRADETARQRLGENAPSLTPEALNAAFDRNPHKVRAFLQVVGSVGSPHILVMVWRILQGLEITAIRMENESARPFHLYVKLAPSPGNGVEEVYESDNIDDAVVLRHLGTMKIGNKGIFDGFYALGKM